MNNLYLSLIFQLKMESTLIPNQFEDNSELSIAITDEDRRLGSYSPLKTVLKICLPSMLLASTISIQDSFNLAHVQKKFDEKVFKAISICGQIRLLVFGLCTFHNSSTTANLSELVAKKNLTNANQLCVDILRFNILQGLIISHVFMPLIKKLLMLFGLSQDDHENIESYECAYNYLVIVMFLPLFISVSHTFIFNFISCGRAFLASVLQILCVFMSLCLFDVWFIYIFKLPPYTLAISYFLPVVMLSLCLFVYFFRKKFTIKPEFGMFLRKTSSCFTSFLKGLIPALINIVISLGDVVIIGNVNYIIRKKTGDSTADSSVISASLRPVQLAVIMTAGNAFGLCAPLSHAYFNGNVGRFWKILLCGLTPPYLIVLIVTTGMIFFPKKVMTILVPDKLLHLCDKYSPIVAYPLFFSPISTTVNIMLLIIKRSWLSTLSHTLFLIYKFIFLIITRVCNADKPHRILYTFLYSQAASAVTDSLIFYFAIRDFVRRKHSFPIINDINSIYG